MSNLTKWIEDWELWETHWPIQLQKDRRWVGPKAVTLLAHYKIEALTLDLFFLFSPYTWLAVPIPEAIKAEYILKVHKFKVGGIELINVASIKGGQ